MSAATSDPTLLHKCIQVGWVPQAIEEAASLRLRVVALTEQRDELTRQLVEVTARAVAAERREERLLAQRASARPQASWLLAWLGTLTLVIDALWEQDMEPIR